MDEEQLKGMEDVEGSCSRAIATLGSVIDNLFGRPTSLKNLYNVNVSLRNYLILLTNMSNLKAAQSDLEIVANDTAFEKQNLSKHIETLWSKLMERRLVFLELTENHKDTFVTESDIQLLLAEYDRAKELYSLYNHIDHLVSKTLSETDRIEKMTFYRKQFDSLTSFHFDGIETTLETLLAQMVKFNKTKDYITSQLSLARAGDLGSAVTIGYQVEQQVLDEHLQKFLSGGTIPDDTPNLKKSSVPIPIVAAQ